MAPSLQVNGQLLARVRRVEPDLAQLFAHLHHLVEHRAGGTGQLKLRLGRGRYFGSVAVQPALGRLQCIGVELELAGLFLHHSANIAGIACHDFVTVGDQGFEGLLVGHGTDVAISQTGRCLFDGGQTQGLQGADVEPTNVELVRLDRQLGRCGVGVVVVVQLFAADQDAPRRDVGAGVMRLKVAVAPIVSSAVDDASRRDRDPGHLHSPDGQAQETKQTDVDDQHQGHALPGKAGVQVALDPVVGCAVAIALEGVQVFGFFAVQLCAREQHGFDAVHMGAMGVFGLLALGMVFAVNGRPLLGHLAGGQPQPETEKVRGNGVQVQSAVRLVTVQVNRDAGDGDVGQGQGDQHHLPPRQIEQAVTHPVDHGI